MQTKDVFQNFSKMAAYAPVTTASKILVLNCKPYFTTYWLLSWLLVYKHQTIKLTRVCSVNVQKTSKNQFLSEIPSYPLKSISN